MEMRTLDIDFEEELAISLVETFFQLERIDTNIFKAPVELVSGGFYFARVYGGLVVSQALVAASRTVLEDLFIHSLHCYFVRPGDITKHILYIVDRTRDGRSFSTRTVKAIQEGRQILTCELSFHRESIATYRYQPAFPQVAPPKSLKNTQQLLWEIIQNESLDETTRSRYKSRLQIQPKAIEIRPLNPESYLFVKMTGIEPRVMFWIRARGKLGDDPLVHHSTAVFVSDYDLMTAILLQMDVGTRQPSVSLDHSIWIHQFHFRTDEWMLYEFECSVIGDDRGLIFGKLWTNDGQLVLSAAQEGMVRQKL